MFQSFNVSFSSASAYARAVSNVQHTNHIETYAVKTIKNIAKIRLSIQKNDSRHLSS